MGQTFQILASTPDDSDPGSPSIIYWDRVLRERVTNNPILPLKKPDYGSHKCLNWSRTASHKGP